MAQDSHKIVAIFGVFISGAIIYLCLKKQRIKKFCFKSLSHVSGQDADFMKEIKRLYRLRKRAG